MNGELLNEGQPIIVTTPRDRIGHGPWARLFATAVVGDEGSSVAERGRALARAGAVHTVSVAAGEFTARVVGSDQEYAVAFTAAAVQPRVWSAVAVTARRNARLAAAIDGREQSVHLEHLMRFDWTSPLVPDNDDVKRACTCANPGLCEHVAAFAYVVADQIDGNPSLLLQWRGCFVAEADAAEPEPAPVGEADSRDEPWQVGALPPPRPLRPLPIGAVLMCLGPSELRAGGGDLADVLKRAYGALAEPARA